jgi:Tat protein translocase TatB subunit
MFNIGPLELLVLLVIALVVVGPDKLPELGRTVGRFLRELRKVQDEMKDAVQFGLGDELKEATSHLKSTANDLKQATDLSSVKKDLKDATDVGSMMKPKQTGKGRGQSQVRPVGESAEPKPEQVRDPGLSPGADEQSASEA